MIVAEAEARIHARTDEVDAELNRDLDRVAQRAGDRMGKTIGQRSGHAAGRQFTETAATELERGSARFARSGRLLSNVFTSNSAAALGPLQEVADKVELIGSTLEQTKTRAGGALLGIGAAATGVGAFLLTVASREEGAHKRLAAAIEAQGGDIGEYEHRIDHAIKAGERFGQSGDQTLNALQALTIGLHDPKKALDELQLAEDVAAAKQIPLTAAANLVRQAYNGNTRVLKAFGIQVKDVVDGQKLLTDAHAEQKKATGDLSTAQRQFTDKLAVYRDTLKPTLAQQIALKESNDKLVTAQQNARKAAADVAEAQRKANAAGSKGQEVLDQLSRITRGQASASADTFIGKLKGIGAGIEDWIAKQHTLGTVLVSAGPVLAGAGAVIEVMLTGKLLKAQRAATAVRDAQVTGAAEGAAAQVTGAATGTTAIVGASTTEVAAAERVALAMETIGPAADTAAAQVVGAAATMDGALATTAGAATGLAAKIRGLLTLGGATGVGALGALGGLAFLGVGAFPDAQKPIKAGDLTDKQQDYLTDALIQKRRAKLVKASNEDLTAVLATLSPTSTDGRIKRARAAITELLASRVPAAVINAEQRTLVDDANAERKAQQHGHAIAQGVKKGAATVKPETTEEWLKRMGLGPLASAKLDKALADAQKKAGERARQIGSEVTRGMRDQLATVKTEVTSVTRERDKILAFRSSVLESAASFTKLGSLIDDPSTSTAGRIEKALNDRLLGLRTFASNLQILARRGLDKGVIAELGEGGPEQRALSSALVRGSDAQIAALNATEKAVRKQQQVVAAAAVDARFGPGALEKANRELARLNTQVAQLNKQIANQPALIAKAVDQARKNGAVTTRTGARTAVTR